MLTIRGWEAPGRAQRCGRLSAKWRVNARVVEFDIPRRCIHRSGQVRVNAEAWNYTRYRADGTPRRRPDRRGSAGGSRCGLRAVG
jgi:hypothetical protein